MESVRIPYKKDDFENSLYARVSWSTESSPTSASAARPIALIYHGGGLLVGSSEIVPKAQIQYLVSAGFVVVAPNYRLCPQVTASESVTDCEEAYEWAVNTLPGIMNSEHGIKLAKQKVVAAGHSTGGTLAMLIGSCKPLTAVTAFYPTLYASDETTAAHRPCSVAPFGNMPEYSPTEEDWASIAPAQTQLSEAALMVPGSIPPPRNRWQAQLLKSGLWIRTICPDGQSQVIDPLTKLHANWPPVMIVQGDEDKIPGSGIDLARRAERDMTAAGLVEVALHVASGANHMFDLPLDSSSPGWEDVVKGLDWLRSHI